MKHLKTLSLLAVLSFAAGAFAQGGTKAATPAPSSTPSSAPSSAPSPAPQAQPTPTPLTTIAAIADRQVSQYEKLMVEAAEAMPADKFDFTPASLKIPGSAYSDVRTFAILVKHTATANYRFWTTLIGEKMPENIKGPNGPDELTTKEQIVQFL